VKDYNLSVKTFPTNIMAKIFGFAEKAFFEATAASQNAPDINFDFGKK
jgi:LemA protein